MRKEGKPLTKLKAKEKEGTDKRFNFFQGHQTGFGDTLHLQDVNRVLDP